MLQLDVTRRIRGDHAPGLSCFSSRSQRRVRRCAGINDDGLGFLTTIRLSSYTDGWERVKYHNFRESRHSRP